MAETVDANGNRVSERGFTWYGTDAITDTDGNAIEVYQSSLAFEDRLRLSITPENIDNQRRAEDGAISAHLDFDGAIELHRRLGEWITSVSDGAEPR